MRDALCDPPPPSASEVAALGNAHWSWGKRDLALSSGLVCGKARRTHGVGNRRGQLPEHRPHPRTGSGLSLVVVPRV